ncbi:glutamate mutase L [Pseudonocardia phyllosphaerae]|uniref:glutamate mutase L n=1 Tax=Pseudonocardia phyllosphaerae TaxID=3390502 RepID=UPI00397E5071
MTVPQPDDAGDPRAATVCLDVGSCWTKAVLVQPDGSPSGYAEHPTTPDVLAGVDAAVAAAAAAGHSGAASPEVLACSSAGGALRLAVVGAERLAATEAAHRVCRTAGARVVGVYSGALESSDVRELAGQRPGVVLLLGGADGEDPGIVLHNAGRLARTRGGYPVLLAVDDAARNDALSLLRAGGRAVTTCPNVIPRTGEIVPGPARNAVTRLYERHVLGRSGEDGRFTSLARTRTPLAVSGGAAALARVTGTGVLVVDIGSATTDVHQAVDPAFLASAPEPLVTVEGDLGLRDGAHGLIVEAQADGVVDPVEADLLTPAVSALAGAGASVPATRGEAAEDRRLAAVAAVLALRRHLRATGHLADPDGDDGLPGSQQRGALGLRGAAALGDIGLVVLTGGVFRQRDPAGLAAVAATVESDPVLAPVLTGADVRIDGEVVLAPAGLLAASGRERAARALLTEQLLE